jgi:hypothetical protein
MEYRRWEREKRTQQPARLDTRCPKSSAQARAQILLRDFLRPLSNSRLGPEVRFIGKEMTWPRWSCLLRSCFGSRQARLPLPYTLLLCRVDVSPDGGPGAELDHALVEILGSAGLDEERPRRGRVANDVETPMASRTQSIGALFLRSALTPSADAKIATTSKNTEGPPDSAISAAKAFPDFSRTPPILGATMASSAPSFSNASRKASSSSPSAPSVTSAPIFRPLSVGFALPTIEAPPLGYSR